MSDVDVLLTLAGALIAVWLSVFVAGLSWAGRHAARRARREVGVIAEASRVRTRKAIVDGLGALVTLSWLVVLALFAVPLLLTFGPLLLAAAGLDLTAHIVRIGH